MYLDAYLQFSCSYSSAVLWLV